jgi:hypothetical protein
MVASTREMSTSTKVSIQKKERNIRSKKKSRMCIPKILTVKIQLSQPHSVQILSQVFYCGFDACEFLTDETGRIATFSEFEQF